MNRPMPSGQVSPSGGPFYIHRHVITFEETNLVGNVYYVRHIAWQGRCREMFLKEHTPEIADQLAADLRLVTLRVSCEYFDELRVFDEVVIRMSLAHQVSHRIGLNFEYFITRNGSEKLAAKGFQEVACMRLDGASLVPTAVPPALQRALTRNSTVST